MCFLIYLWTVQRHSLDEHGKKGLFVLTEKEMSSFKQIQRQLFCSFGLPCFQLRLMNFIAMASKNMNRQRQRQGLCVAEARADAVVGAQQAERQGQQLRALEHLFRC